MEGVCLGRPCGHERQAERLRKLDLEEEVLILREQVRDLSEMNMVLRSQMDRGRGSGRAMTKDSVESNSTLGDAVHPEQVNLRGAISAGRKSSGRASIREEEDDDNLLDDPNSPAGFERTVSVQELQQTVKLSDLFYSGINSTAARASALGKRRGLRIFIFTWAFLFVIFVLVASSTSLGSISEFFYGDSLEAVRQAHAAEDAAAHAAHGDHSTVEEHGDGEAQHQSPSQDWAHINVEDEVAGAHDAHADPHADPHADAHADDPHGEHRRLAPLRRLGGGTSPLLRNIAFCLTTCGLVAFFVGLCKQPLILGYLLGGVLVGPNLGLELVRSHESVAEIANLGLVFLLFMIGLELDVKEILRMGRVVLITGVLQFPVCFGAQYLFFVAVESAGLKLGSGSYAAMYCALVCGISSTMIVVKLLSEKGETDRPNGRLTVGILIFQDIWAMVFLAIQPNLASPDLLTLCKQFGMIFALIVLALSYAKFVMPAVLFFASKSVELMLVLSLSWCFFMGVTAQLPWVGVGMELAALIAGVALATFPYSAEFNGKIKYIRDFFITLFFAALGMQIPVPSMKPIFTALLVALIVLIFRWLGIFSLVYMLGGTPRLGILATLNLSQISEFALVICSLGMGYGHIDASTLEIIIWVFMILSIFSSNLINYNHQVYQSIAWLSRKICKKGLSVDDAEPTHEDDRDILMLGFHRIGSMLIAEFEHHAPKLLRKLQVVEFNQSIKEPLLRRGVKFSYGDFSSADVLEHCFHGEPKIIISTTPDTMLQGTTNMRILKVAMSVWPKAHIIVTADNPEQASELYEAGAHYVLRSAKLCAERLFELLNKYQTDAGMSDLKRRFDKYKRRENDDKRNFVALKV
ncbi:Glutathione-regulated potassium-efflux system protein KefC (K(+)/H(+) antiporter) [Durusdinium trenchii]|uniref:Glutathione-regulated potassium-efflux system protein KefC (K(+)/H(+) antiporter) n=1 Tax=Durusdinium trenchii TaxID=1381693 RepID=A0ABP0M3I7_9DINO